ncbi:MAG: LacI family transcriptional regulator [Clostridiales bacterium]|nr:LacI family transcriptional regulator [Clostridiales bacterium]
MSKAVTIAQVAGLAKVSSASVSMILNGRSLSRFSPETVRTVREAADTLGYRGKHRTIERGPVRIICPSVMNPYYAFLLQGVQQVASAKGYDTTLHTTYWDMAKEQRLIESFRPENTSGVIFVMIPQQLELAEALSRRLPMVAVGDRSSEMHIDTVDVSNRRAGEMMGEHLLTLGHKRVAYISTTLDATHSARVLRLKGLQRAFAREPSAEEIRVLSAEVTPQQELEVTSIEHEVGLHLTQRCLKQFPEVTAFVAINDMVAYGVLDALWQRGLSVPQDYSVCGFDNIYPSRFLRIGLTTVEHSIEALGQSAFHLLAEKIEGKENTNGEDAFTRIEYRSRLIVRDTTGVPRKSTLVERKVTV